MIKPKPTFDWGDIDAARSDAGLTVSGIGTPLGAFTVDEYANRYDVARSTAAMHLAGLVRAGRLKACFCYRPTVAGRRRVRCYWHEKAKRG